MPQHAQLIYKNITIIGNQKKKKVDYSTNCLTKMFGIGPAVKQNADTTSYPNFFVFGGSVKRILAAVIKSRLFRALYCSSYWLNEDEDPPSLPPPLFGVELFPREEEQNGRLEDVIRFKIFFQLRIVLVFIPQHFGQERSTLPEIITIGRFM